MKIKKKKIMEGGSGGSVLGGQVGGVGGLGGT